MKIIITESQYNLLNETKTDKFKKFLKNRFEIDLTGKIKEINRFSQIPNSFKEKYLSLSTPRAFQDKIQFGSMYLIQFDKGKLAKQQYIYQKGADLMSQDGGFWSENHLMELLGLNIMGLSVDDLIDIYYESIYDI
jgi:hypothetical protein